MSTTSQHSLPARAARSRAGGNRTRARGPRLSPIGVALMGPANRSPGVPTMGAPGRSPHPVMGRPDAGSRVSIMGIGSHGPREDVFGSSDISLVDFLFTGGFTR